jgi:hypothetical protein
VRRIRAAWRTRPGDRTAVAESRPHARVQWDDVRLCAESRSSLVLHRKGNSLPVADKQILRTLARCVEDAAN